MSRKSFWRLVLGIVAIAALASADVYAQGRGGGRGGAGGRRGSGPGGGLDSMTLLRIDEVKEEIELTDEQAEDLKAAAEEQNAARRERRGGGGERGERGGRGGERGERGGRGGRGGERGGRGGQGELSEEDRQKFIEERRKQAEEQAAKAKEVISEILLPHQIERLDEIALQLQGSRALTGAAVAEKIGLSKDDLSEIEEVLREAQESMREKLFAGGRPSGEDFMAKITEARKEVDEQVLATLSDDQKEEFEEMKGEPFDLSMEKLMRSRFGRGGPGGGRGGPGGARGRRGGGGEDGGRERRRPRRPDSVDDDSSEEDSQ